MDHLIQVPLNLPDVRILATQRTEQGYWVIHVESILEGSQCRRCGREIRDLHGRDAVVRLRYLPLFEGPVFVEIRPKWYCCPYCAVNPTTTQRCGRAKVELAWAVTSDIVSSRTSGAPPAVGWFWNHSSLCD